MVTLSRIRFYASRRYAASPTELIIGFVGIALFAAVLTVLYNVREQALWLRAERAELSTRPATATVPRRPTNMAVPLPTFVPDRLVADFNSVAKDMQVPLDDVVYALDKSGSVPYQRYHITLSSKAGYAQIRRFVAAVSSDMPNVSLDSIRCARPDAAAPALDCELAFSAFFANEAGRG